MNRARVAVTAAFVVNGFVVGAFVARLPDFKEILGITDGGIGRSILFSSIGLLVGLGPVGRLCAKVGSSRVVIPASIALALSTVVVGFSHNVFSFSASLFFFGLFLGTQDVSMNAHAVVVEHKMNKRIMSTFHATFSSGALVGSLTGGLLSQWKISILAHTVGAGAISIIATLAMRHWWLPPEADIHPVEKHEKGRSRKRPAIFWALGLIVMFGQVGEGAAGDWGGILSRSAFRASPFLSTLPFIFFSLTMVTGRFLGDGLASRFGARRLIIAGGLLSGLGLTGGLFIGGIGGVIGGWIFLAAGSSIVLPLIFSIAGSMAKNRFADRMAPAEGMAMVSGIAYFGFLAGPPVIGLLADHITLRWAMLLPALLALGIALGSYLVIHKEDVQELG